jgi:hypothetical protein
VLAGLLQVGAAVVDVHAHPRVLVGPVGVVVPTQLGEDRVDLDSVDVLGPLGQGGGHVVAGAGPDHQDVVEAAGLQVPVGEEVEGQDLVQRVDRVDGLVRDVVGRHDEYPVGVLGREGGDLVVGRPVVEGRRGLDRQQRDHAHRRSSLPPPQSAAQQEDHPDADDRAPDHGRQAQERQQREERDPADAAHDVQPVGLQGAEADEHTGDGLAQARHHRSDQQEDDRQAQPLRQGVSAAATLELMGAGQAVGLHGEDEHEGNQGRQRERRPA